VYAAAKEPSLRGRLVDVGSVRREFDSHIVTGRVLHDLVEVFANHWLSSAKIHVENPQRLQLIDDCEALLSVQLARVPPTRGTQTMNARKVARIGQLPGEADGSVEPGLQLSRERGAFRRGRLLRQHRRSHSAHRNRRAVRQQQRIARGELFGHNAILPTTEPSASSGAFAR